MKQDIAALWVERLRSGKVEQAKGQLGAGDTRCCLGVLCDIAVEMGVIPPPTQDLSFVVYDGADVVLPESVQKWAGVQSAVGLLLDCYDVSLVEANDTGFPFSEIADLIEKNVDYL
jgi:hypothetical protein